MHMTIWDLGIWGLSFSAAWLLAPIAWKRIQETAVSAMETDNAFRARFATDLRPLTVIVPPLGEYLTALLVRLVSI